MAESARQSKRDGFNAAYRSAHHERDYIERTIATVRNHQHADNSWPQWANIFADEIERLWGEVEEAHAELDNEEVSRSSYAGPFGDIKYEDRRLNLAGRIHILAARAKAKS